MKKILIIVILIITTSCSNNNQEEMSANEDDIQVEAQNLIEIDDLELGMSSNDVISEYGEPLDSIGSGVSILLYYNTEKKVIVLNFNINNQLIKVSFAGKDGNPETVIIE